jgi:hypothetical protein
MYPGKLEIPLGTFGQFARLPICPPRRCSDLSCIRRLIRRPVRGEKERCQNGGAPMISEPWRRNTASTSSGAIEANERCTCCDSSKNVPAAPGV